MMLVITMNAHFAVTAVTDTTPVEFIVLDSQQLEGTSTSLHSISVVATLHSCACTKYLPAECDR
eukprot:2339-Heterococcus_DN1.PRE.3